MYSVFASKYLYLSCVSRRFAVNDDNYFHQYSVYNNDDDVSDYDHMYIHRRCLTPYTQRGGLKLPPSQFLFFVDLKPREIQFIYLLIIQSYSKYR